MSDESNPANIPPPLDAPPPIDEPRWSLVIYGKVMGPYTDDALRTMLKKGWVAPSTKAWDPAQQLGRLSTAILPTGSIGDGPIGTLG